MSNLSQVAQSLSEAQSKHLALEYFIVDDIFNKRIMLPGFKLGDSMLQFLAKFDSLT